MDLYAYRGSAFTDYVRMSVEARRAPNIKKVIFNPPCTIVLWADNTKTVVKAENEDYDPEKGLAMAISKKALGNKGNYFNEFKKWTEKYEEPSDYPTTTLLANITVPEAFHNTIMEATEKVHKLAEAMRKKERDKLEHSAKWLAYQRLQNALGDKKATKADLRAAMEEASKYLLEVIDVAD